MAKHPWPELLEQDQWLIAAVEQRLAESEQSSDDMRTRACELREYAQKSDIEGFREAALALAERYEKAATSRIPS